jgi:hypothetical protein
MEQTQVQCSSFIIWIFYYISVLWYPMELVIYKIKVILSSSLGAQKFPVKDCVGLLLSPQQPILGPLPEPVHCSHLHSEFLCFLCIANWNKFDTNSLSQIAFYSLSVIHKIARVKSFDLVCARM